MSKNIFSKDEFHTLTEGKFVLVELDFPRTPEKVERQSMAERARNQQLAGEYGIRGYPTVILADASGKPYAYTGPKEGGPEEFVKHLDELRNERGTMKASFKNAAKYQGVEKAKSLVAAVEGLPDRVIAAFYPDVVAEITEADPKYESGFAKRIAADVKFAEFQRGFQAFDLEKDGESALAYVQQSISTGTFAGEKSKW